MQSKIIFIMLNKYTFELFYILYYNSIVIYFNYHYHLITFSHTHVSKTLTRFP